jgi:hypothetical protein
VARFCTTYIYREGKKGAWGIGLSSSSWVGANKDRRSEIQEAIAIYATERRDECYDWRWERIDHY